IRRPRRLASHAVHGGLLAAFADALHGPAALRHQLGLADRVVAPSRYVLRSFVEFGLDPSALHLWPHGTDVPPRTVPKRVERPIRFGFVGPISRHKGLDILSRAFRGAGGESTLSIYGPVLAGSDLDRVIGPPTPRIRYQGVFERDRAASVYDSFDVLVVPSVVAESFSLTAIEAQARGLPVIASDIGALPERVQHGVNGLLVLPGDVSSLRAALEMAGDPNRIEALSRGVAPPLSMELHIEGLESLYHDALGRRPVEAAYA
ncbi:MAG TPA: glycosyltransferase, partial [Actinomycetota bacterium]|nr:glycosyltransferase [Actinomycetota bacterium]